MSGFFKNVVSRRDLAVSGGAALVGSLHTGSGALARTMQDRHETVSVKDFGAKGDSTTDDSAAFISAINFAIARGYDRPRMIHIPAGTYRLMTNNVLGQWTSIATSTYRGVIGFALEGDSADSTILMLENTGTTDKYFYDNYSGVGTTPANNSLQWPSFRNLGFKGKASSTGKIHCFRSYGTANGFPSQGFNFHNCKFSNVNDVLQLAGSVNDSENKFIACTARAVDRLIYSTNPQAGNHYVLGVDVEDYKLAAFQFTKGGGVSVIGGSFISTAPVESFLLIVDPVDGAGVGTFYSFSGLKTELRNVRSKIVKLTGRDNDARVTFNTLYSSVRTGAPADAIQLDAQSKFKLEFNNSIFSGRDGLTWKANNVANYWQALTEGPCATFNNCGNFSKSNITWEASTLGYTRIYGTGGYEWEGGQLGQIHGADRTQINGKLKVAHGYGFRWPSSLGYGLTCVIPVGSIIKGIYVRKPASGSDGSKYQMQVTDGAGTPIVVPVWASGSNVSVLSTVQQDHTIVIDNLLKTVTDATTGTINVTTAPGHAGDAFAYNYGALGNEFFFVEYF